MISNLTDLTCTGRAQKEKHVVMLEHLRSRSMQLQGARCSRGPSDRQRGAPCERTGSQNTGTEPTASPPKGEVLLGHNVCPACNFTRLFALKGSLIHLNPVMNSSMVIVPPCASQSPGKFAVCSPAAVYWLPAPILRGQLSEDLNHLGSLV